MGEWEHHVHRIGPRCPTTDRFEAVLNQFGTEGWELVQVLDADYFDDWGVGEYAMVFKRLRRPAPRPGTSSPARRTRRVLSP